MSSSKPVSIMYVAEERKQVIGFGELDGKGRELGLLVNVCTFTAGPGPRVHRAFEHHGRVYGDYFADAARTYYPDGETLDREPGVYYAAYAQATRAGKSFGACQSRTVFTTAEARDAWVAKRIAAARKRAPKAAMTGPAGRRAQP